MAWASTKTKAKAKSDPVPLAMPKDPNLCFVQFPSANMTTSSVSVSLQSLLNQLQKQPSARQIEAIQYDSETRRIDIRFAPDSQNK
ncbi:hypothetical protein [Paenibacillus sanguinis]|uniref:hypothetical protein n=1 Tax=Paenibacillus sanguinis TaxID=225906 RepID=UPI000381EDED|nr:hypothetical protein [Paenibacillus sanguinis]